MNTDDITHIRKHLLANSRESFHGDFACDKVPPLNSIQSRVPCCNLLKIGLTGIGGCHSIAFFHTRRKRLELFDSD